VKWRSVRERVANYGLRETVDHAVGRGLMIVGGRQLRRISRPSLADLHASSVATAISADQALAWLLANSLPAPLVLRGLEEEYRSVHESLLARYADETLPCPDQWKVGTESARLLYMYVRIVRPARVVETGVANGHSSYCILSALDANSAGHLWSLDVRPGVGVLVPASLRTHWTLGVCPTMEAQRVLRDTLDQASPVDLFIHDSDHTWFQQMAEYKAAHKMLGPGAVIMSDDVDKSYAWIDWCAEIGAQPLILFDGTKAVGVLSLPSK
jgi:predicted O-methyltransferase YrrM